MRIGICDRDQNYVQWITGLVRQIDCAKDSTIVPYSKPGWLIEDVYAGAEAFDILIISQMQERLSGVEIVLQVCEVNPQCRIILLTEENVVIPEAYQLSHGVLLPKEHVPLHLITVVNRLAASLQRQYERYISLVADRERRIIPCSQILYLEKVLRKTVVTTKSKSYETYQSPKELLERSGCTTFSQCHRSFYVNLINVKMICPTHIKLTESYVVPVGNTFAEAVRSAYDEYCANLISGTAHL